MKRFLQVWWSGCKNGRTEFDDRCSCALACGYIPCGNSYQQWPVITGDGDISDAGGISGSLNIETETNFDVVQSFYDPEGKATLICGHCTKCETCSISPESDVYCSKFEDVCYKEDE